jgi:hypothetical protein
MNTTNRRGWAPFNRSYASGGWQQRRGSVLSRALDYDIMTVRFNNDIAKALLPSTTLECQRDSGMCTNYLGVNLRDQVRQNDSTPLQFKYEAAGYRIFYSLDNVYNISRLWRDAVTASFDDSSLCVEGLTGYSGNSSKPAPTPSVLPSPLSINLPDSNVAGITSELTSGILDEIGVAGGGRRYNELREERALSTRQRVPARLPPAMRLWKSYQYPALSACCCKHGLLSARDRVPSHCCAGAEHCRWAGRWGQ